MATVGKPHDDEGSGSDGQSVDLEVQKVKKCCRFCHLSLDTGIPIELGCSCKNDLGAAHKQCAEIWFMNKGDRTCEICGESAGNVDVFNNCYDFILLNKYYPCFLFLLTFSIIFFFLFVDNSA